MKYDNTRNFKFWKYNAKTDRFTETDEWVVIGVNKKGNLRVRPKHCAADRYWGNGVYSGFIPANGLHDQWIKKEYFDSSYSQMWQQNINRPKYMIREVFEPQSMTPSVGISINTYSK